MVLALMQRQVRRSLKLGISTATQNTAEPTGNPESKVNFASLVASAVTALRHFRWVLDDY